MKKYLCLLLFLFPLNIIFAQDDTPKLVDLDQWLGAHNEIALSIKWQISPGNGPNGSYEVLETNKINWKAWSNSEKTELRTAFEAAFNWYFENYTNGNDGINLIIQNTIPLNPTAEPICYASIADARAIYLKWVAHSLLLEIYNIIPWSIRDYDSESLNSLFDSSYTMRRLPNGTFVLGFDHFFWSPNRRQILGTTLITGPIYTYKFLQEYHIVDEQNATRLNSIKNILTWCRDHMAHFYGNFNCQNCQNHWGHFGNPPFIKVAEGTNAANGQGGFYGWSHWTAGCYGTTSFIRHALRAINIPAQLVVVCSSKHYTITFPTENVFICHGDDPYNSTFKNSGLDVDAILLPAPMFQTIFGIDFNSPLNPYNASCSSVGYGIANLPPH